MNKVAFPGLGIEEFQLDPVAFNIPLFGGIEVRWYGIVIVLGMILAFTYCAYRAKQEKVVFDDLLDMAIFTIIFGIIGARAYYVITSLDKYDSFYDVIAIWEGGLAIYGGLIAGALTVLVVCKIKKIKFLKVADAAAPGVMIAQAIGRWGNFFNGEAYGAEVLENSPLYFIRMGLVPNIESVSKMHYFHPTFLYECLWNVLGFVLINLCYKKKKFDGQIFLMYVTWYGFGRMLIEGLRTDSLYVGVFRISQVVGFVCFVVGGLLLILKLFKSRRASLTAESYDAAYPKFVTTASTAAGETATVAADADEESEHAADESAEVTEQEQEKDSTPEYNDISDRLGKLFDIGIDDKKDE